MNFTMVILVILFSIVGVALWQQTLPKEIHPSLEVKHYCIASSDLRVFFLGRIDTNGDAYVILSDIKRTAYIPANLLKDCENHE